MAGGGGEGRGGGEQGADIKSNNPHLTGGEITLETPFNKAKKTLAKPGK